MAETLPKLPPTAPLSQSTSPVKRPIQVSTWRTIADNRFLPPVVCAGLLILFATLSYTAVLKKCATYDETLHVVAGYVHRTIGDYRINPEDPALFGLWGSLPHSSNALKINRDLKWWDPMLDDFSNMQWPFVWWTLYHTPGNNVDDSFLQHSRFMFILVGVMLGALIAWWSWRIAGAWAAVAATTLFALDPNFSAHAALVKNDVMLALTMAGLGAALWSFGRRGSWLSLTGICLATAAAVNVKFSGVLAGPITLLVLLLRALLPSEWIVFRWNLKLRWQRLIVVPAVCVVVGFVAYVAIWACYGFRYGPSPDDPSAWLSNERVVAKARQNQLIARTPPGTPLTQQMLDEQQPGRLIDLLTWAKSNRLLPQAWLHGFMFTYASTLIRSSYLLGESRITGWWYYFPLAMAFKTPTPTILAILGAGALALSAFVKRLRHPSTIWAIICLATPVVVYLASAMTTNLNLGLRHVLPVYPFFFVATGVVAVRSVRRWKWMRGVVGVLALGLCVESLAAYPNYLPFFNIASARSADQKLELLGDSNLDWGQDLPALAAWRAEHKDLPLVLDYFGIADPGFYGIDAKQLPPAAGGFPFASDTTMQINAPCYFAISATNLQGIYVPDPTAVEFFKTLRKRTPQVVLGGGSIYVFRLDGGGGAGGGT